MKRSPELAVLSREHHLALELALRLTRTSSTSVDALRAEALAFWRSECSEHFRLEETVLLPAFADHAGAEDPDVVRIRHEHTDLRRRFAELEHAPADSAALKALGERLAAHVRFEERTLFGRVESVLDPEELALLGRRLQSAGADHDPPRA